MLARRFTIVCLITALFGMVFAIVVAESGRQAHSWNNPVGLPCWLDEKIGCRAMNRN